MVDGEIEDVDENDGKCSKNRLIPVNRAGLAKAMRASLVGSA
jgi:hypothetical protein